MKKVLNIKSKTHNFGAAIGIFAGLQTFLPQLREFMTPDYYGLALGFIGVSVIVLRNVTTTAIDDR